MRSVPPRSYLIGPILAVRGSVRRSSRGLLYMRFQDGTIKSAHVSEVAKAYLCDGGFALLIVTRAHDYYRWLLRPLRESRRRRLGAVGDYFCEECGPSWDQVCDCGKEVRPRILWKDPSARTIFAPVERKQGKIVVAGVEMTPWEVLGLYRDLTGAVFAEVISLWEYGAKPIGDLMPLEFLKPLEVRR